MTVSWVYSPYLRGITWACAIDLVVCAASDPLTSCMNAPQRLLDHHQDSDQSIILKYILRMKKAVMKKKVWMSEGIGSEGFRL